MKILQFFKRLKELDLFSLKREGEVASWLSATKRSEGTEKTEADFMELHGDSTKGNVYKLQRKKCSSDIIKA